MNNQKKIYIYILRFDVMVSVLKPSNAKLTLFVKLNYLPSCSHFRTKQTAQCQSVADRLQKVVGCFRYSDWLTRKIILKLAN